MLYRIIDIDGTRVRLDAIVPLYAYGYHHGLLIDAVSKDDPDTVYISPEMLSKFKLTVGSQICIDPAGARRPSTESESESALRYNEGKPQWSLVDFDSLEPMVRVLEFGAKKYAPDNWKKPMDRKKILDSLMRHLVRINAGEEIDPESGLPHIGHLLCNALFYSYHARNSTEHPDTSGQL